MAKQTIVEEAGATARFHTVLVNARRNFKNKKALFDKAEQELADAQANFEVAKSIHGDKLRELR